MAEHSSSYASGKRPNGATLALAGSWAIAQAWLIGWLAASGVASFPAWLAGMALLVLSALALDLNRNRPPGRLASGRGVLATALLLFYLSLSAARAGETVSMIGCLAGATVLLTIWERARWKTSDREERADDLILIAVGNFAFFYLSWGIGSWRWAFAGDEYAFYFEARRLYESGFPLEQLLSPRGVYGMHPVLGSAWQALPMLLLGPSDMAWRTSNLLFVLAAIPPLFELVRKLFGRRAAAGAIVIFASSHVLFSISKLGWHNAQVLYFLPAMLCFAETGLRERRFFPLAVAWLLGGLCFYTFGLARVFPVLLLIRCAAAPSSWSRSERTRLCAAGLLVALLTAAPLFTSAGPWQLQLEQTIPEPGSRAGALDAAKNVAATAVAFLISPGSGAFVAAPHLDPLSAALLIWGLIYALARRRDSRAHLAIYGVTIAVVGALHKYASPPQTRLFVLVIFYAIFGGLGLDRLLAALEERNFRARTLRALAAAACIAIICINAGLGWGPNQSWHHWLARALEVAEEQGGSGEIYVAPGPKASLELLKRIFEARGGDPGILHPIDVESDPSGQPVCLAPGPEALAIVASPALRPGLEQSILRCWPGSISRTIVEPNGEPTLALIRRPNGPAEAP